jgi:hypothetical protein
MITRYKLGNATFEYCKKYIEQSGKGMEKQLVEVIENTCIQNIREEFFLNCE